MAKINILAPFILSWEGGFVNDPADRGGATNKGVTIASFKSWRKSKGLPEPTVEDLKKLTDEEAIAIMKEKYWDRWKADQIKDQSIANILVDWVWGSGVYGIKIPQKMLGVKQDGIVGPQTLAALNAKDSKEFFLEIKAEREAYFNRIVKSRPANAKFLRGWLRRLSCIRYGRLIKNGGELIIW